MKALRTVVLLCLSGVFGWLTYFVTFVVPALFKRTAYTLPGGTRALDMVSPQQEFSNRLGYLLEFPLGILIPIASALTCLIWVATGALSRTTKIGFGKWYLETQLWGSINAVVATFLVLFNTSRQEVGSAVEVIYGIMFTGMFGIFISYFNLSIPIIAPVAMTPFAS